MEYRQWNNDVFQVSRKNEKKQKEDRMSETARIIDITDDIGNDSTVVAVKQETGNVPSIIKVTDNGTLTLADQRVLEDNAKLKAIHDKLDPKKARAHQVWSDWNEFIKEMCAPWEKDKEYHVAQVKLYNAEIRRQREAEESRLREIARKEEEERILREAEALQAEGRTDEADEIMSEPVVYVAPAVRIETPKVDNRMYKTALKVKVNDRMKFLSTVRPETLLELIAETGWIGIESGLSKKAKSLGRAFNFQGCTVTEV
jgi:hypothetical protein